MKYVLKKIIIGVAIGTILFIIKGGNVFASTYTPSNFTSIIVHYSFDLCTLNSGTFICVDAFSDTKDLKQLLVDIPLYTTKSNEYLMLKELSVQLDSSNAIYTFNGFELPPFSSMFTGLNMNTKLYYNNFLNYYGYKTSTSATEYTTLENNKWGAYYYSCSVSNGYKYCLKPYVYFGSTKNIYSMLYSYQSGYNYAGSNSIIDSPTIYSSASDLPNAMNYINNEKNNTYLAVVLPNTTLKLLKALNISSGWGGFQLINGNWNDTAIYDFAPTTTETEINENMAEINKQMVIASSFIGSDEYDTEQQTKFSNAFSNTITSASSRLNSVGFTSFLNALVVEPVALLNQSASIDFYSNGELTGSLCFPSFQQGGTNSGWIPIPFVDTGNYTKDYFQVPCLTTDVYSNLKSSNTTGIKNGKVIDFGETPNSSSHTMGGIGFLPIWLLIQHAVLYVWLTITFVNIVKYCIDTKDSEIEVMDL